MIAVNDSWRLAPWADLLHGCDAAWWIARQGVPDFRGIKTCLDDFATRAAMRIERIRCLRWTDAIQMQPGLTGWGGNSGFHALNIAAQLRPARIVMVGYDMTLARGLHWHGRHTGKLGNPTEGTVARWRRVTDAAAPAFAAAGIEVINASPDSALKAYPKRSLEEIFDVPARAA